MADGRLFSFFQDSANRSIALAADDNLTQTLLNLVNQHCNLNLTETARNCSSPSLLIGIFKIATCTIRQSAGKAIEIGTCDDPALFENATKQCLENAASVASDSLGNIPCTAKAVIASIFGGIVLLGACILLAAVITHWCYARNRHAGFAQIAEDGKPDEAHTLSTPSL